MRENTSEILEFSNYKVFTAENGKIGVETANREKPDLIICDIMMPVLDGYGVLQIFHSYFYLQKLNEAISGREWKWELMIILLNHSMILNF